MSAVVIDASIAVKWFLPEPHTEAAHRLLVGRRKLLAPDLIWAEVGNVLWKRCRRAEITREVAQSILRDFKRFPIETFAVKPLLEPAWELATQYRTSVYDGLYLALAVGWDCKLATADRSFYDAIKSGPLASIMLWVERL